MPTYNYNRNSRFNSNIQSSAQKQPKGRMVQAGRKRRTGTRRRKTKSGGAVKGAQIRLKNFRQATILAVAITGFIMLVLAPSEAGLTQQGTVIQADSIAVTVDNTAGTASADTNGALSGRESAEEAIGALQNIWNGFIVSLPKFLIAIITLFIAWGVVRLLRRLLEKLIGKWQSSRAVISLAAICVWLLAIGVAVSVVAGDIRALLGSLGLVGLALSWSLQTPIESFTGWLLNSFQGYYRVGDRIRVGEVFGDVYRIDFLTTTVWEIGAPYQPGYVQAEQPTGRMVTFPNNEILTGTVINLTGDFPYVWDELSVSVANESDIRKAMEVLEQIALTLLGDYMVAPARQYASFLKKAGLENHIPEKPQVFLSTEDSWTNITIRYLVGARERRKWKSELILRISQETSKPENAHQFIPVYPRQQVQVISPDGVPVEVKPLKKDVE
jgi:small-conductance mechanosensitive channel